jgi:NADH dehydrogenase FAD-containing subunit
MAQTTIAPTSASAKKTILLLGGSYGGVSVAHYVLQHVIPNLPDRPSYQVVLVSASAQVMCRPACPRALISDDMFPQAKLFVDTAKQFAQYPSSSFRFVQGTAIELDHAGRTVSISRGGGATETIDFHALVIATGASTPSPLLGLNVEEQALRKGWATFRKALPAAKTIVIAGGGPAGVETAGELGEYLNGWSGWFRQASKPKVPITLVTAAPKILPALRPAIATQAEHYLAKVGVTVVKNARVTEVSPREAGATLDAVASKATITLATGETLQADLYIPATGTKPNGAFVDKALLLADGRVDTNASTLRVDKAGPRVYAIGDVASWARPAIHHILAAVPVLCANLERDLQAAAAKDKAGGSDRTFKEDTRETQLVPIGKSKGVGAAAGYRLPSFLVWLIKGRDYWVWMTGNLWSGKQWAKRS